MKIAIIGLGKMGLGIVERVTARMPQAQLFGFDINPTAYLNAASLSTTIVPNIAALKNSHITIFWIMLPAGSLIDHILGEIQSIAQPNAIIIDAGNSFYEDSQRRAKDMAARNLYYLDCGTSGGIHGVRDGFCFMVGGPSQAYKTAESLFATLSVPGGYAYVGDSGAGHYVKMIHNGIEYGLMQAYAEGLHILKEGTFKDQLSLESITGLWNTNAVIRSFLLGLTHDALQENPTLHGVSAHVNESGMGSWTDQEAQKHGIADPVLKASLNVREQSRINGGNFGTKILSLLRNKFGGHSYLNKEK